MNTIYYAQCYSQFGELRDWYSYTNLDQLHILSMNSTRRVLQKISLHHCSILSASSRKNTL